MTIFRSPAPISASATSFESVFVAGGISNCEQWQDGVVRLFAERYDVFNPRRIGDFAKTGKEAVAQITWEFEALDICTHAVFWFPKESICPITLFELGKVYEKVRNGDAGLVLVGWDKDYERAFDLDIQTGLVERALREGGHGRIARAIGFDHFKAEITRLFGPDSEPLP